METSVKKLNYRGQKHLYLLGYAFKELENQHTSRRHIL